MITPVERAAADPSNDHSATAFTSATTLTAPAQLDHYAGLHETRPGRDSPALHRQIQILLQMVKNRLHRPLLHLLRNPRRYSFPLSSDRTPPQPGDGSLRRAQVAE